MGNSCRDIWRILPLAKHDVEAALELCVACVFERGECVVALQKHLAFQAGAAAGLAPFADQRPAAEQILLQGDLVVTRLFCGYRLGLHVEAHGGILACAEPRITCCARQLASRRCSESSFTTSKLRFLRSGGTQSAFARDGSSVFRRRN